MLDNKKYAEAALSKEGGTAQFLTAAGAGFDKDAFEISLYEKLKSDGVFSLKGGMEPRNWLLSNETPEYARELLTRPGENLISLASSNGGEVQVKSQFTAAFQGLMKEITPSVGIEFGLANYFPEMSQYSEQVQWTMVNPYHGRTQEYTYGANPESVPLVGNRQIAYRGVPFREQSKFTERELTYWRDLGSSDLAVRGAIAQLSINMENLITRTINRQYSLIADGLFNNSFSYQDQSILFGIPSGNRFVPQFGAWATRATSSAPWVYNDSANPFFDLINWVNNSDLFKKYRPYLRSLHMNPVTWGAFIQNPNVRSFINLSMGNPAVFDKGVNSYADGKWVKAFIPGLEKVDIIIEDSAWIPDENVTYDANGYYDNSTATWFLPDGYIFFGIDTKAFGGPLGSFQLTIGLQKGGISNPQPGRFVILDDNIAPGTRGGPANPFVGMVAGFTGGLAVPRAKDVISAMVFTTDA